MSGTDTPGGAGRRGLPAGLAGRVLSGLAGLAAIGLVLAGCGGKPPETPAAAADDRARVGIFVDNAFGDGDFFDQAAKAKAPLTKKGAVVNTYEGQLEAQNFAPLLQDAADANDLVFVLGFEAIDALVDVAQDNPQTTFVFVDGVVDSPDVVSASFRTAEGCFMAGALATTVNRPEKKSVAGFVGGANAPVVKKCQSGYEQGVRHTAPDMTVAAQYVGSFVDPAKGREIAIALANKGAYSIFAYAGLSGTGVFDAAKSGRPIAPIGIVSDKSHLAPGKTPGSLEMGVDDVILQSTEAYENGKLQKGSKHTYGFAEGGWSMIYDDKLLTKKQRDRLRAMEQRLADGKLVVE